MQPRLWRGTAGGQGVGHRILLRGESTGLLTGERGKSVIDPSERRLHRQPYTSEVQRRVVSE